MTPEKRLEIEEKAVTMLRTVYDPEIPVDIYSLGLIYKIDVDDEGILHVALISRGNEKLSGELLERQSEILSTLYGDGMELSDEELESSMTAPEQTGSVEGGTRESTTAGSGESTDASQDTEPEETSGDE